MKIVKVQEDNELYKRYSYQSSPQSVYISLDLPSEILQFEINYETSGTPIDVYNRMRIWFGPVPAFRADQANSILEAFAPIARNILENLEDCDRDSPSWIDEEIAFSFEEKAHDFVEKISFNPDPDDIWSPWDFSTYFNNVDLDGIGENGLTTKSTPEDITEAAEHEMCVAEYPLEGDVDDLVQWITDWVERTRDEEDDDE